MNSPESTTPDSCTLRVGGMDCSSCADTVRKALYRLDGVQDVQVDVLAGRVDVGFVGGRVQQSDLAGAIVRAGYSVEASADEAVGPGQLQGWWTHGGRLTLAAASGALWLASLGAEHLLGSSAAAAVLAVAAMVAGGWFIVPRGVRAAMNRALDMNFLMSIAAIGALFIGEYEEAASALFLFSVAQLLETWSMDRARNAIRALMNISPAEATVMRNGREQRVPAGTVRVGEIVVARPGEKIAVDGDVVAGRSSVNQAAITGESMPLEKEPGSPVYAGTINGEGVLEVRSTRAAEDTTLARIIHAVDQAQASRAPSQTFVDRFARIYTPIVVVAALVVFLLPPLLGFGAWSDWFYRALVLLVVACPCALVISTPVTVVSALAGAARRGILIKGGLHLENAGRVTVVALDKTGTLTEGEPEVMELVAFDGAASRDVLQLALSAESRSEHPLARAIVRHAAQDGILPLAADDTRAVPGRGIVAMVNGRRVHVGSERYFNELGAVGGDAATAVERFRSAGRSVMLIGEERRVDGVVYVLGAIGLADRVRSNAAAALRALHHAGIRQVVMLTGDNAGTAQAVADEIGRPGVDEVRAGLLPQDKVSAVQELRAGGARVLMVGDGVNDAPALAAADVGVAMASAGTDVAIETADIALMTDDLSKLAETIRFARKSARIIRANIAFALLSKAAFVILAVAGMATLWMAVLADMGASLIVIANGLRAMRA